MVRANLFVNNAPLVILVGEIMHYLNLQIGKKKAKKRCPWINDDWYKDHPDVQARQLGAHRKTTTRCSAAIHG
jgi:hypothetical protein